jgi:hypothetical protein
MPINSNQRQNSTFSQSKGPKTSNTGNRPTVRRHSGSGKSRKIGPAPLPGSR